MTAAENAQLKQLISASPLLTEKERQEWFALLPNMNPKQLSELEEILRPAVRQAPVSPPVSNAPLARLSHIKNVPHFGKAPEKSDNNLNAGKNLFEKHLQQVLTEKELPAAPLELAIASQHNQKTEAKTAVKPNQSELRKIPLPQRHPPQIPQAQPQAKPATAHLEHTAGKMQPLVLPQRLADVALLQPNFVRVFGVKELAEALNRLIVKHGYFETLLNFEQSPLYKLYVYTGSRLLEQNLEFTKLAEQLQMEHRDYYTRGEFEYVTDILKGMQINEGA